MRPEESPTSIPPPWVAAVASEPSKNQFTKSFTPSNWEVLHTAVCRGIGGFSDFGCFRARVRKQLLVFLKYKLTIETSAPTRLLNSSSYRSRFFAYWGWELLQWGAYSLWYSHYDPSPLHFEFFSFSGRWVLISLRTNCHSHLCCLVSKISYFKITMKNRDKFP